jgi:4-amino-4-deoxy-L-arabinose transferase-like glycosyltransferase
VKRKTLLLLWVITIIGAVLRVLLLNAGVDIDDVTTAYIAEASKPTELFERIKACEFAPPLYFMIMCAWVHTFGSSSVSLVIPSIVFGIALIPCVYHLAKELFERDDVALTSAFFTAVSPLATLFSREVRSSSLIALLSTIAFFYFIKCLKATRRPRLVGLAIATVLMLYTHYFGLLLVFLMITNTLAYTRFPFKSVVFKPLTILAVIGGCLLAFAPWLPVLLDQEASASFWTYQESIGNFLFLFTSNLAATLPVPWNASFVLLSFLLPIAAVIVAWKALGLAWKGNLINFIDHNKGHAFLLANLLIPIVGYAYFTPYLGSQRYVMSFMVFGLIFWAALTVTAGNNIAARLAGRSSMRRNIGVGFLCCLLFSFTFVEIYSLSDGDRSGLRQFAKDWKAKKFKRSAVLIAPDFDSYNLIYYLTREQKAELPPYYYTFPVQPTLAPSKPKGYQDALNDPKSIRNALRWIEEVDVTQAQNLVVIADQTEPFGKLPLAKTRSEELINTIKERYPAVGGQENYTSRGRSFTVQTFKLAEPPD